MPTSEALTTAVVEFERAIQRLANQMARSILEGELQRRVARQPAQLQLIDTAPAAMPESTRSRRGWTREAVVQELTAFLRTKFVVDGAFISRHGPPGLVTAAKKHFGRLDAALNVASLAVAKQTPPADATSDA